MKAKVSNSQTDVRIWKERLAQELKKIPPQEYLAYIDKKVSKTLESLKEKRESRK